jgi:hypothetical protein
MIPDPGRRGGWSIWKRARWSMVPRDVGSAHHSALPTAQLIWAARKLVEGFTPADSGIRQVGFNGVGEFLREGPGMLANTTCRLRQSSSRLKSSSSCCRFDGAIKTTLSEG